MEGQKGIGGFKGVVSCWAMLLARIYDVFPLVCPLNILKAVRSDIDLFLEL